MTQSDTDSGSVSGGEEAEATSDEESLVVMRKEQAQVVRNMRLEYMSSLKHISEDIRSARRLMTLCRES
ncbi:hypothetical protein BFJ63_vAg16782 [Fusarium oxysporum f. sp. narcissi]|uniref:Uncharacterized protein n=1 Tax=Fusarium oxysporum f. sp. narcissi TaxID=451672 RepID=A0A4Q2V5W4_FUSOX|nr:hypothetical protein BFJ63_vAg16782 [Fusarium oxysporum f. sp. narcissi]